MIAPYNLGAIMRHVGILGGDRTGKDTIASLLVEHAGYQRVSIADPLKELAVTINSAVPAPDGTVHYTRDIVSELGWERVKDRFPAVRDVLWDLSDGICEFMADPDYWTKRALSTVGATPCVVTDIRTADEVRDFRAAGFALVRLTRPGIDSAAPVPEANCDVDLMNVNPLDAMRRLLREIE